MAAYDVPTDTEDESWRAVYRLNGVSTDFEASPATDKERKADRKLDDYRGRKRYESADGGSLHRGIDLTRNDIVRRPLDFDSF